MHVLITCKFEKDRINSNGEKVVTSIFSVASKLVDKLPSSFNLFHTESLTFKEFYVRKHVQSDEFMLTPVNDNFINKELCKLNPSKSTGTDNIPAWFVKDAASFLTKHICHIVNLSIDQSIVPNELKNCYSCTFV